MKKLNTALLLILSISMVTQCQVQQTKQPTSLDEMTTQIENKTYPGIHSVLISRGDSLLYERYFNGYNRDSLHDTRSAFKSITSLLAGIAIDRGFIKDVHQPVLSFFPEYAQSLGKDARKKAMTIKDLLEMKAGFDCEEFDGTKDCENDMANTKDWVKFSLELPMKDQPGTVWAYSSSAPMIISGIISKATGMPVTAFAKKYLFDPLGITHYRWTIDPAGHAMTAGSFYIRPLDMLKIGQLVRNKGVWKGSRIISSKWIQESTQAAIPIPDFSYVRVSKTTLAIPQPTFYGYYWYREAIRIKSNNKQEEVVLASGNGGQYIMIIDRLDLVVVFTQGNYGARVAKQAFEMLVKYILP
jgi:CubicO group peptidase (beta-lactamase class C family)